MFALIAFCCGISLAQAQPVSRGVFGCSKPLDLCTQERIVQLRTLSRSLSAAANMQPPAGLSVEQRRRVAEFDNWLRAKSEAARRLADSGARAQATKMSFNLQYLHLQQQMQNENRSFTAISNIMKTKHDTTKNAISNIR